MRNVLEKIILHKNVKKTASFLKENRKTILTCFAFLIFGDIFFLKNSFDIFIFGILAFYIFFIKIYKISSKLTFLFCLGLLAIMSVDYFYTEALISTEKAAVWLILFLVVGVIQGWKE